jgi:hypothetical protein
MYKTENTYKISYKYPLLKHGERASGLKTYRRDILDLEREKFDFDDAQEGFPFLNACQSQASTKIVHYVVNIALNPA